MAKLRILGILLVLPALLFIAFAMIVPFFWNIGMSFMNWNGFSGMTWNGMAAYAKTFQDIVTMKGISYSIQIAVTSTVIAVVFGVLFALAIYKVGMKEGAFYRFVFFAPSMMPVVVIGFLFTFILATDIGLLNKLLEIAGLASLTRAWLAEPGVVIWSIGVIGGWRSAGFVMILVYAAVVTIPSSMFEAARLEGMGYLRQIRTIILPLIMPTLRLTVILMLIVTFKTYDIIAIMTKGGPGDLSRTVPVRLLDVAFQYNDFGYAAAIGVLLTVLVVIVIAAAQLLVRGQSHEY